MEGHRLERLPLEGGGSLDADVFVFAPRPGCLAVFPDVVGRRIATPRQEVLYFGPPAGDSRFTVRDLPVWMDFAAGSRAGQIYGVPATAASGFKVADDAPGPPMDPHQRRNAWSAPTVWPGRARSCPSGSPRSPARRSSLRRSASERPRLDAHLIRDRHPQASNVWIAGGGIRPRLQRWAPLFSPAICWRALLDDETPDSVQSVSLRFSSPPPSGWSGRWS